MVLFDKMKAEEEISCNVVCFEKKTQSMMGVVESKVSKELNVNN